MNEQKELLNEKEVRARSGFAKMRMAVNDERLVKQADRQKKELAIYETHKTASVGTDA